MKNFSRRTILAVSTTAALLLAGCSSEPSVQVDQPVGASVDPARVTLVEAGENPVLLEYKDLDNEAQNVTIRVGTSFQNSTSEDGNVEAVPEHGPSDVEFIAPLEAETAEPTNSDSQRSITITLGETKAEHNESTANAGDGTLSDLDISQALQTVTGFRLGWFANNNGQVSSVNFAAPTDASDEGRALIEQMFTTMLPTAVVFPTEPVGVGGSWTVDSRTAGESPMLQTITYTVTEINGDKVTVDVEVNQRPTMGAIPFEQDGEQRSLQVLNSNTTSEGTLTIDLNKPLPESGSVEFVTRVVYGEGENPTRVVQDSGTSVVYE